jgi:hypothetical protein
VEAEIHGWLDGSGEKYIRDMVAFCVLYFVFLGIERDPPWRGREGEREREREKNIVVTGI